MGITLEICVPDAVSAVEAARGGANRVELCENLSVGGTTPSAGSIAIACRECTVPVHVLIRPRAGGFCYSATELTVMSYDVAEAKRLGASGIVIGVLTARGTVDHPVMQDLIALARPMTVTFHKAFDLLREPVAALEQLIDLGVDRILTSGGAPSARNGTSQLRSLVRAARQRIQIMAGGRITAADLAELVAATGVAEVHVGSAAYRTVDDVSGVKPNASELLNLTHAIVDPERVRLLALAAAASGTPRANAHDGTD